MMPFTTRYVERRETAQMQAVLFVAAPNGRAHHGERDESNQHGNIKSSLIGGRLFCSSGENLFVRLL